VVSACNLPAQTVAASEAIHVFQEGFLAHCDAAMIGTPTVPLVELYSAAEEALRRAGGEVRLSTSVVRIDPHEVETADGERLAGDAVICAVPFERALRIVSDEVQQRDPRFEPLKQLKHSSILGVHLTFDEPVLDVPHAALVGVGTQWLFRKDEAGKRIHAVISGADSWMSLSEEEIISRVVEDVRECLPTARAATLISGRSVKEKRATFAPTPGSEMLRPSTTGPSGLILAGDYVQTGWPSTMEGATRSGYRAAAAAMGEPKDSTVLEPLKAAHGYRAVRAIAHLMKLPF